MTETHAPPDWRAELAAWVEPFLERLAYPSQRHWAEVYLWGLLGFGERKSVEAMASRVAPGAVQQLHHFLSTSTWDPGPLEAVLVERAQHLVGGSDAVLCVDDTALVKKGELSVGVAPQYCGQLGKKANCQHPGPSGGAYLHRAAPLPTGALGAGYRSTAPGQSSEHGHWTAEVAHRAG